MSWLTSEKVSQVLRLGVDEFTGGTMTQLLGIAEAEANTVLSKAKTNYEQLSDEEKRKIEYYACIEFAIAGNIIKRFASYQKKYAEIRQYFSQKGAIGTYRIGYQEKI